MADPKDDPEADGTEMLDLGDVDVSSVQIPPSDPALPVAPTHERSVPPPLPPEVRASHVPLSQPPPPPRSNRFYVLLLVAFVVVGAIVGLVVAKGTRGEAKPAASASPTANAPSAKPGASVMTLPTIDMTDETDAGN